MTTKMILRHNPPPTGRDPATHLYEVGQAVRLKRGVGQFLQSGDVYHITRRLPPMGDSPQYRIRNDAERYERVVVQDSLEPVRISPVSEGTTLIERTFGHEQGTETRQSRDQEAQTGNDSGQA